MALDLLEFESEDLYFDEPLNAKAEKYLDTAAEVYAYSEEIAEVSLLRAYFLEPEHPVVLVALYRYYYYQHRLEEALLVADQVLRIFAKRLELPEDWRELDENRIGGGVMISMIHIRFYMLALKGAGYIELRLGEYEHAVARLEKVTELDTSDHLGAQALLNIARNTLDHRETDLASAMHMN
jgi:tetratricopeptide (TPR) repeat protein